MDRRKVEEPWEGKVAHRKQQAENNLNIIYGPAWERK